MITFLNNFLKKRRIKFSNELEKYKQTKKQYLEDFFLAKIKSIGYNEGEVNIFVYDLHNNIKKVDSIKGINIIKKNYTNIIITSEDNIFNKTRIIFRGKNNICLILKSQYRIDQVTFDFGSNSILFIEDNFSSGPCVFRLREEKNIFIGNDCMFSSDISVWTSDGHAILDNNNRCINRGGDIVLMDHVWIGHGVKILKNTAINKDTVVGGNSLVNKKFYQKNLLIAGSPASIIKRDIHWVRESPLQFP